MAKKDRCKNIDVLDENPQALNELIECLIEERGLEIYDVSGDFDEAHKKGVHQAYHTMVVLNDDMYEMNAQALMPNGINMWAGDVSSGFKEREKDKLITDVGLLSEQMKKAIKRRYQEDL